MLTEYSRAPQVTRERMYLETMQQVFSNASKIYVDARGAATCCTCRWTSSCSRRGRGVASGGAAPPSPERVDTATDPTRGRDGLRSRDRDAGR